MWANLRGCSDTLQNPAMSEGKLGEEIQGITIWFVLTSDFGPFLCMIGKLTAGQTGCLAVWCDTGVSFRLWIPANVQSIGARTDFLS